MNYETNRTIDLTSPVALYSTALRPAGAADAGGERPWGAPGGLTADGTRARTEAVAKVIGGIGQLLDVLQPAHRAGNLLPGDIQLMQRLELWYSELQAEQEHVSILKAPPTVNT